jgi:hypothetical protein
LRRCGFRVEDEPFVLGVVTKNPIALGTRHDVKIVEVIAVSRTNGMVAPRHEDDIAVVHANRLVEIALIGIDTLKRKTLRGHQAMVVRLFQRGFLA